MAITKYVSEKTLDLEYNSAKIIASPYDYRLTERLILRDRFDIVDKFNIFKKGYATEMALCNALKLDTSIPYMNLNPEITLLGTLPKISEAGNSLIDLEYEYGMCGNLIKYNNLNLDETTFLKDFEFEYPYVSSIQDKVNKFIAKDKHYLKALEVWHLMCTNKSSLIPNLFYLMTEYYNEPLESLENIDFAEAAIKANRHIVMESWRFSEGKATIQTNTVLSGNTFLLPIVGSSPYTYGLTIAKKIPDDMYRIGLFCSLAYGAEMLYHLVHLPSDIKLDVEELLKMGHIKDSFCSRYLYDFDKDGSLLISSSLESCFNDDTEIRFDNFRRWFLDNITDTYPYKDIVGPAFPEYVLPIFFMRMVCNMHSYAYQIARVKHATLIYKKAKEAGVLKKEDMSKLINTKDGLFGSVDMGGEDALLSDELLSLDDFVASADDSMSAEESIEKEKSVHDKRKEANPTLNAMDALKKDLHDSPYSYDINYVKHNIECKDSYLAIAKNIKLITTELTRQIKEIKTYNSGGKQSGLLVGKLDKKNLWKYKTDPHIFYNNNYKLKELDLAFGCILDESGSMYGEKIKNGRIVMVMLHEVLNSLGINHSIIGHTSSGMYQSKIFKYYQFKEESHYSLDKPYGLVKADNRSGNCDSGALYYMQCSMKQVRNKDKIVIIFSDGQPTECTDLDLTTQVRKMEKDGIHVIGVGINFESIKEYYPDNANGRNLKEMVDIVVSILKRYVLEKKE